MTDHDPIDLEDDVPEGPSKTRRKKDSDALQRLGAELVALSAERLKKVPLPDNLRDAVRDCQRFKMEARRRQLQYIGKLMRNVDPEPIQAMLDVFTGVSAEEIARQHRIERQRDRLLEDEGMLFELAERHPGADLQRLRVLRRNALKERETQKPPRAYRELFRILREIDDAMNNE
ncbi:ribosome biogenesis factor YjgA [Denitromonas sp.]|uniref:ribosome biogenesis factor YjgA n=1 Tax=Denitromonas sp. TaxID=2734609 RepID=UPI003A871716